MNFTCQREKLLSKLNIVIKAVSQRSTLPILQSVLITAEKNGVILTATDLELGIESSPIPAEIKEEGSIAIEAKILYEIIRRFAGDSVTVTADEKSGALLSSGLSELKIMGMPGDEFPVLPKIEKDGFIKVGSAELRESIRKTVFSVSQDPSKPVLNGELMEFTTDNLNVVSLDGFRISYCRAKVENGEGLSIVVPAKTLLEVSRILTGEEEEKEIKVYITDKHILLDLGDATIISRLLEGEFLKYEKSFPPDFKTEVRIFRQDMLASLERASLISRDSRKTPVKLSISGDGMKITAVNEMGRVNEEIQCGVTGEDLEIAFNPKYLIDVLRVLDEDTVDMRFNTPLSPCVMAPVDNADCRYLVLPLRM